MAKSNFGKTMRKLSKQVEANAQTIENLHHLIHNIVSQQQGSMHPPMPGPMPMPQAPPMQPHIPNMGPVPMPMQPPVVVQDDGQVVQTIEHEVAEEAAVDPDEGDDRPRIDVVMPVKEGRYVHNKVLASIENQGFNTKLWMSTLHSDGNIANARNQVKQYASTEYALMHDNDIILPDGIMERMVKFLEKNQNFGAVAVSKKHVPDPEIGAVEVVGHVDAGPVMWRTNLLHEITYRGYTPECQTCECLGYCEDLRAMGYEVGFLTGVMAEHIAATGA